jgi:hypothetical protein
MNVHELQTRPDAYLALREALGYATHATGRLLHDFVAYLERHGDGYPIRAHLAVDWACRASATWRAIRTTFASECRPRVSDPPARESTGDRGP